jgi:2-polyprenyl-6-methoxyphenol hydroxylase-like FAD-dependent oxidoreductase
MPPEPLPAALDCDVAIVGYGPVGAVLANMPGRDGREPCLLDEAFGPGFGLTVRESGARLSEGARAVLERVGGSVFAVTAEADVDGACRAWLDRRGCDAVLVRPDHVVFGAVEGPDAGSRLLEELGGFLVD